MNPSVNVAVSMDYVYRNNHIKNANYKVNRENIISIKDIFLTRWDSFYHQYSHRLKRDEILKNVNAFLKCGTYENGYLFYSCPNCQKYHITAFTCKSRFCPSCAQKYRDARALNMSKKCVDSSYRHIVFTIPQELRIYFLLDRKLLHLLFKSVNDVFTYILKNKYSKYYKLGFKNGFMSALHTFGRDIKWNPHIHVLMSEILINKDGETAKFNYFHYESLRKSFMKCLLDNLYNALKTSEFYKLKCKLYKHNGNGFYVYAPKIQMNSFKRHQFKSLVEYVTRYASHPPMSESRITNVDYDSNTVTYFYDPHEDDLIQDDSLKKGRTFITESIDTFIGKLITHIPPTNFHTIRYYGFFSNRSTLSVKQSKSRLFSNIHLLKLKNLLRWRQRIIHSFNYDPIICDCGFIMEIDYENCYFP